MPAAEQPKSLSAFIQRSHSEIIGEFSAFARTLMPPNSPMTEEEMRDHCKDLLIAIAEDLDEAQTSHEQSEKSRGHGRAHRMRNPHGCTRTDALGTDLPPARCSPSFGRFARPSVLETRADAHRSALTAVRPTTFRHNDVIRHVLPRAR